jgi:hypothetical protein
MFDRIRSLIRRLHEASEVEALTDRELAELAMTRKAIAYGAGSGPEVTHWRLPDPACAGKGRRKDPAAAQMRLPRLIRKPPCAARRAPP